MCRRQNPLPRSSPLCVWPRHAVDLSSDRRCAFHNPSGSHQSSPPTSCGRASGSGSSSPLSPPSPGGAIGASPVQPSGLLHMRQAHEARYEVMGPPPRAHRGCAAGRALSPARAPFVCGHVTRSATRRTVGARCTTHRALTSPVLPPPAAGPRALALPALSGPKALVAPSGHHHSSPQKS